MHTGKKIGNFLRIVLTLGIIFLSLAVMKREFQINTSRVPELQTAVKRLVKAAARAGLSEPRLSIDWSTKREVVKSHTIIEMEDGRPSGQESISRYAVEVVDAVLDLPDMPAQDAQAYELLGILQATVDAEGKDRGENEIFAYGPHLAACEALRHAKLECVHCRAKRLRTKTCIIRSTASGELRQVGKECAQHYVGNNLEKVVAALEFVQHTASLLDPFGEDSDREYSGGGGGAKLAVYDAAELIAHSLACVRVRGWQPSKIWSKNQWGEDEQRPNWSATWRDVQTEISGVWMRNTDGSRVHAVPYVVTAEDRTQAEQKVLPWISGAKLDAADEKHAYLIQMQEILSPGWVSSKRLAFVVSIVKAFERGVQDSAPKPATNSPEGRVAVKGVVVSTKTVQSDFGLTEKMLVKLEDGNKVWSSVPKGFEASREARVHFKATFTRSDKDPHFSFGSRPILMKA